MDKLLLLLLLAPATLLAQPTRMKKLIEKPNYVNIRVQHSIIAYLNEQKIDPSNYFIDSIITQNGNILIVNVWDKIGIQRMKRINEKTDSLKRNNLKLKIPKPTGNPGNCFSFYYDVVTNKMTAIDYWQ